MHILLINANPLVSRLIYDVVDNTLATFDEIDNITDITDEYIYDIIFVDEEFYSENTIEYLATINSATKIFFSYAGNEMMEFDVTIKKPFLPSQIADIIADVKESNDSCVVLDIDEISKIKELLDIDDDIDSSKIDLKDEDMWLPEDDSIEIVEDLTLLVNEEVTNSKEKKKRKKEQLIEEAFNIAMKNLTKKEKKKLFKGKEIEVTIKLKRKS